MTKPNILVTSAFDRHDDLAVAVAPVRSAGIFSPR